MSTQPRIKSLVLDGISNYIFFLPLVMIITGLSSKWTILQYLIYAVTAIPISLIGGIIYGRFLNKWRKYFKYD